METQKLPFAAARQAPSETSLEGWKQDGPGGAGDAEGDFRNFLRGMETNGREHRQD